MAEVAEIVVSGVISVEDVVFFGLAFSGVLGGVIFSFGLSGRICLLYATLLGPLVLFSGVIGDVRASFGALAILKKSRALVLDLVCSGVPGGVRVLPGALETPKSKSNLRASFSSVELPGVEGFAFASSWPGTEGRENWYVLLEGMFLPKDGGVSDAGA